MFIGMVDALEIMGAICMRGMYVGMIRTREACGLKFEKRRAANKV